jgi:hypothetical protein
MGELEFSIEQILIIKSIDNSKELVKLFKRLIYISGCSYIDLSHDIEPDFKNMLDDILQ